MGLDIYWLQFAEDKLQDIYYYYSLKAGKRIAKKLINNLIDSTINLENHPEIGPLELGLAHRKQEFRYLITPFQSLSQRTLKVLE